ncbi:MAG: hypothetical protein K1X57_20135 [Gemmataceae bacterium]|nr:hypothetical protein [Gemmataceae bacterium]
MNPTLEELVGRLHGVTGPEGGVPPPAPALWPWLLAGAAVILVLVVVLRRRPRLSPDIEALAGLQSARDLATVERVVRAYLARQFDPLADSRTPAELARSATKEWAGVVADIEHSRFAPAQPAQPACDAIVTRIELLIHADRLKAPGRATG